MHHRPSSAAYVASWRIRCVRLVAFALLWGWLAAPLVQALGTAEGGTWVQVCTSLGTRLVQLDQDDTSSAVEAGKSAPSASPSTDCPYCRVHAGTALVPADMQVPVLPGPARAPPLPPAPQALPSAPAWRAALPRAPPSTISA